jgi:hypothetical protein
MRPASLEDSVFSFRGLWCFAFCGLSGRVTTRIRSSFHLGLKRFWDDLELTIPHMVAETIRVQTRLAVPLPVLISATLPRMLHMSSFTLSVVFALTERPIFRCRR